MSKVEGLYKACASIGRFMSEVDQFDQKGQLMIEKLRPIPYNYLS